MTTPTPKFCYHGNAVDCCDACDREETIGKLKSDLAAAQDEAKTLLAKLLHAEALLAGCSAYLKDGETPVERIQREIADCAAITRLYAAALKERDAAQEELERVRDKCNEHYMALAAAQEDRQRAEAVYQLEHAANLTLIDRAQRAERVLKQFFLNDSPWPDVESREEMQSFIDNMTTEEIGRWGKAHPHHLCAALLIRCQRAEKLAADARPLIEAAHAECKANREIAQRAEALAEKIKQILLPDPHDEREVSAEWQVKAIHAAIDAAREGK